MNAVVEALDEDVFDGLPERAVSEDVNDDTVDFLDQLGYVNYPLNARFNLVRADIAAGIQTFRSDLAHSVIGKAYRAGEFDEFSEIELEMLDHISSLDGDFALQAYPVSRIAADPLLCRVLNFRLSALGLVPSHQGPVLTTQSREALGTVQSWLGLTAAEAIEAIGDMGLLIQRIAAAAEFPGSPFDGVAVFNNPPDTRPEQNFRSSADRFRKFLNLLHDGPATKWKKWIRTIDRRDRIPSRIRGELNTLLNDPLNRFLIRTIQIRLWIQGLYVGRLDTDMGPFSLEALAHMSELLEDDIELPSLRNYLYRLTPGTWLLNVKCLFSEVLRKVDLDSGRRSDSVAGEVDAIATNDDLSGEEKEAVYAEVAKIIGGDDAGRRRRPKRTRGFLGAVGRFFIRVGKAIAKGIKMLIKAVRRFFDLLKNGVRTLWRELKTAFQRFRDSARFIFGSRRIRSGAIQSHYDGDFDAVTQLSGTPDEEEFLQHQQRLAELVQSVDSSAQMVEVLVTLAINLMKGPIGWLKLGIALAKRLFRRVDWLPVPTFIRVFA